MIKIAILLLACVSQDAFASRARNLVLGTGDAYLGVVSPFGNGGSLYVNDDYNVFYNPVFIVDHKNKAIVEKSNFPGGLAQGGASFVYKKFHGGLYVNRVGALPSEYPNRAHFHPIEAIFGFKFGKKKRPNSVGASFSYGTYKNDDIKGKDYVVRLGARFARFVEPYAFYKIEGSDRASNGSNDINSRLHGGGVRFYLGKFIPFLAYRLSRISTTANDQHFGLGTGNTQRIGKKVKVHFGLAVWRNTNNRRNVVPFNVAAEADINDWLGAMIGLSHHLLDENDKLTFNQSTTGRVGAKIKFKPAEISWAVGRGLIGAETGLEADAQTVDFSNGFFTALSMAVRW